MGVTIRVEGLSVRVGGRVVLEGIELEAHAGELLALVGPNGAGKSTLLHAIAGDLQPAHGTVRLDGDDIRSMPPRERARRRAVLSQENGIAFPFPVAEVVAMGRAPWARRPEATDDDEAVRDAVAVTDVTHLLDRPYTSLSGGERARVALARVLAQGTDAVLLDEPTAALDLRHQEDVMHVAADLARRGRTVVVVLHDLALAAAFAHRVAVLSEGQLAAVGAPLDVLTPELIARVYGVDVRVETVDGSPVIVPRRSVQGA
jgi:iron complex transport system ATP-binding protein